jgi:hypothetical protein
MEYEFKINNFKKNQFCITFQESKRSIINAIIAAQGMDCSVADSYKKLIILGRKVINLESLLKEQTKIDIDQVKIIIRDISLQLKYMILSQNQCPIGFHTRHIFLIDDKKAIFIPPNSNLVYKANHNDVLQITTLIDKSEMELFPEMMNITEIPFELHYKCNYYSFGSMILKCIKEEDILVEGETQYIQNRNLLNNLPIRGSKLYYFLERLLENNPENRYFLYI